MAQMLLQTIEQIGREKNIEPQVIIEAVEEAMAVAAQKFYGTEDYLEASLNPETGEVELAAVKRVVEVVEDPLAELTVEEARAEGMDDPKVGDELRRSMSTDQLGRIAAHAARQVIFQKVRDAERDNIYVEYVDRVGELLTGIVKRFERGDMMVDLGRTEAILPRREQSRAEHYNIGDRIRLVIIEVLQATRGPMVVVSRNSPELLKRLFEMEVPEIYDQTVVIKGAVREGGDRAKVAVQSNEPDVDPVGACVGMRGSRVQAIIRELRGEKIDIVEWSPDRFQFAINALKPARVNHVKEVDVVDEVTGEAAQHLQVIVNEDQLSLAIGKRGQNVRLAGKLLGCKIDVGGAGQPAADTEKKPVAAPTSAAPGVEQLEAVGATAAAALREAGFETARSIVLAGEDALLAVAGIGPKSALKIYQQARDLIEGTQEAPEVAIAPVEPEDTEAAEPEVTEAAEPETTEVAELEPAEAAEPEVTEVAEPEPAEPQATEVAEPEVTEADESGAAEVAEPDAAADQEPALGEDSDDGRF